MRAPLSPKGRLYLKLYIMAIGLFAVGFGAHLHWSRYQLMSGGHSAIVEPVTQFRQETIRNMTSYTAELHWRLESGRAVQARATIPDAVRDDFKQRRPVRIFYDSLDYNNLVFENNKPGWLIPAIGLCMLLFPLLAWLRSRGR
jgi:hypothetical protein